MPVDTRLHLLNIAEVQFAERGFYGVSIAQIAGAAGLSKQALLHHFGTKEKLYGEVLGRISAAMEQRLAEAASEQPTPTDTLIWLMHAMLASTPPEPARARLLMRELLDNRPRAAQAEIWYLKPFLAALADILKKIPGWQNTSDGERLARIYQLLGAALYYSISGPTLQGLLGEHRFAALDAAFPAVLDDLMRRATSSAGGLTFEQR